MAASFMTVGIFSKGARLARNDQLNFCRLSAQRRLVQHLNDDAVGIGAVK
jgi:hypothetical protein